MRWPLWLSQAGIRLRALLRARRLDRELDEELAFHLDMAAEAAERRGLSRPRRAGRPGWRSMA